MTSAYRLWRRSFGYVPSPFGEVALVLLALLLGVSCGDVYRPVALPIPGQSPTPAPVGHMVVISTNGSDPNNALLSAGSASRLDVSGDSVVSSSLSGLAPGRGALNGGGRLYVPNTEEDTVFASPTATAPQGTIIDLQQVCNGAVCPSVNPVYAETTESTRIYVAGMGNGTISVIDTNTNAVVGTFAVDTAHAGSPTPLPDSVSQPVALAELPNGTKIYSVNKGADSVSSVNTQDGHINRMIPVGPSPLWAAANADNLHVYVLDSAGTIWIVDTTSETATPVSFGSPGPLPNHVVYDKVSNRVFATDANSAQPKLAIFDVTSTGGTPNNALTPHGSFGFPNITPAPGSACTSNPIPTAVTVIGDGSRAYVASYQTGNGLICTQVTVVDIASGTVTKTIPLFVAADNPSQTNCDLARFRAYAASSLGSMNSLFKVYISQCDAGMVAIVDTAALSVGPSQHPADSLAGWVASPVSTFPGSQINISAASQPANSRVVTYTYNPLSGPQIQPGMTVYIAGLPQLNGAFVVTGLNGSTFDVVSNVTPPSSDISLTGLTGTGSVIPAQNPVFLTPAP